MYYLKEMTCLYCDNKFKTTKILTNRAKTVRMDSDFCFYYEWDNPMFYNISICTECGFAFNESCKKPTGVYRDIITKEYIQKIKRVHMIGERTIDDALYSLKLALVVAQVIKERRTIKGDILLKIAWIHRMKTDKIEEQKYLQMALTQFTDALSLENIDPSNSKEDKLIYLIAELNSRLGNYTIARKWFSYLITDKKVSDKYRSYAVERWNDYKEELEKEENGL